MFNVNFDKLLSAGVENEFGQPVGCMLVDWVAPPRPERIVLSGRYCRIEPLDANKHAAGLFTAMQQDVKQTNWTYLAYGPFVDLASYRHWLQEKQSELDPLFYTIINVTNEQAVGLASYLSIDPSMGCIEIGHLYFSPLLQKTPAATEAMYLMMRYIFELGYRRYEWKCNALNVPSYRAAQRLGFTFEGLFRQARIDKGRNRDTAWFSMLDKEWPVVRSVLECWLQPDNFTDGGVQKKSLLTIRNNLHI
ncbi:GNAT family N-acetyltransferase [Neisseriaceae bacterium TC5R-5]|nr:GNAT family N-acetyltransferase [Neisseriaceae bacterium TC5R-5]